MYACIEVCCNIGSSINTMMLHQYILHYYYCYYTTDATIDFLQDMLHAITLRANNRNKEAKNDIEKR